ncbi:MAG TPA: DNA polymerase III subunit beta [Planctomycetaceae bacterium]|nr:DNA polymerase III subunit beta [Planctomycetaceae bacterium]
MNITCDREKLLYAVQLAGSVVPARSPKPILENIKLEVGPEAMTVMATDLEVAVRTELSPLETAAPGSAVIPMRQLAAVLKESSEEKIRLESDAARVQVYAGRSEFQFPTQNPDEYPTVSPFQEDKYHQVPARFFRELIRRTVFATETESTRYALGGVLFELYPTEMVAVATDGRRLARQQGPAESVGGHVTSGHTIVPSYAIQLMERAVGGNEENVQLAVRENDVLLRSGRTTVYSRLLEGRFPEWRQVFPKVGEGTPVEMTVGPLLAAVRQAAIVTSGDRRGVEFTFAEGTLTLAGHGAEQGDSHVEMPVAYEGEQIQVKLDPRYMIDFLRVLDPEATFTLHLRGPTTALLCTTEDGYAYMIMPLSKKTA